MTRTAFVFPGQGSQRVGMGRDVAERHPGLAGSVFREADELLGFELSQLCWEGPADELRRTDITQPAIFVTSIATLRVLSASVPEPVVVAGHSLGEYAALVAAGVLEWTAALSLVHRRGELMAGVNETTPGAMAAIIGLAADRVEALCSELSSGAAAELVEVANYNDDEQTVVSGTVSGVEALTRAVRKKADPEVKVVRLDVGAPFHCSLMRSVEDEFARELEAVEFADPRMPVVANVTAAPVRTGDEARAALRAQLAGSVRWRQGMRAVSDHNVQAFVEVGPGRVLSGLVRRSHPETPCHATSDARRIDKLIGELGLVLQA
ncbi:ACP S-malonyltransferase [Phytoactinopolyspora endophytica]|uniref:ACP S-malonyltransferase n=1 Tax=Phytoactinopolyspora endophytica TaxID=1642495 RepID=UPI00101C0755|nr:ACP S-malonyltransferase [Phytoactinopolyspora endophytica]